MGRLLLGSIPGVLAGSQWTVRLPERGLRVGLATVLLLSGVKLLGVPGSSYLIPVVLAAGLAALVWTEVRGANGRSAVLARGRS